MGAKYKRKRHSCPMCKPHKMGMEDKMKPAARQEFDLAEVEMDDALKARHSVAMGFCPCGRELYGDAKLCDQCEGANEQHLG